MVERRKLRSSFPDSYRTREDALALFGNTFEPGPTEREVEAHIEVRTPYRTSVTLATSNGFAFPRLVSYRNRHETNHVFNHCHRVGDETGFRRFR